MSIRGLLMFLNNWLLFDTVSECVIFLAISWREYVNFQWDDQVRFVLEQFSWLFFIVKFVYIYSKTCLNRTPVGLKNLFSLDRFKLHRTISRWGCKVCLVYSGFCLDRFLVYSGFWKIWYEHNIAVQMHKFKKIAETFYFI
jgi:hypothetical protein